MSSGDQANAQSASLADLREQEVVTASEVISTLAYQAYHGASTVGAWVVELLVQAQPNEQELDLLRGLAIAGMLNQGKNRTRTESSVVMSGRAQYQVILDFVMHQLALRTPREPLL